MNRSTGDYLRLIGSSLIVHTIVVSFIYLLALDLINYYFKVEQSQTTVLEWSPCVTTVK